MDVCRVVFTDISLHDILVVTQFEIQGRCTMQRNKVKDGHRKRR